ncbi:MAG: family 16 glycosylhydrolase [Saprospiraceae bacterium]|nr:family 16 glycosylhydrolase [Saprospiraceae bacterium]
MFNNKNIFFKSLLAGFLLVLIINSCAKDSDGNAPGQTLPELSFVDVNVNEGDVDQTLSFDVTLSGENKTNAVVSFSAVSASATTGDDFKVLTEGKLVFSPGETKKTIQINLIGDESKEFKEIFTIKFYNPISLKMAKDVATFTITDDDDNTTGLVIPTTGYATPLSYPGYKLVWADEFDSTALNTNNWVHETGAGGWGNSELQHYREDNTSFLKGNIVITAKSQKYGSSNYTSSRLKTQGKKAFKYGRIDIRAVLPKGQGMWPALWMLGSNITSVNWPACGEIDIMELAGNLPNRAVGTVHFGANVSQHQYKSMSKYLTGNKNFQDEYHVFSIIWKENLIEFFVDDEKFHSITPADLGTATYPFNKPFFFIMNVAVGGTFPGNPDNSTPFPQSMVVDYLRVFQPM